MSLSPIVIETHENAKTDLAARLGRLNLKTVVGPLAVDLAWTASGRSVMGDNKTPSDLIASVQDGRLHKQMEAAKAADIRFVNIEGSWSRDGMTVGQAGHAWTWEAFNNLVASLQVEGIVVLHSPSQEETPRVLKAFYEWTDRDHGSWHQPERFFPTKADYADKDFYLKVGMLMHLPDCGQKRAEALINAYGMRGVLGIADLTEAKERWLAIKGIGPKLANKWYDFLSD